MKATRLLLAALALAVASACTAADITGPSAKAEVEQAVIQAGYQGSGNALVQGGFQGSGNRVGQTGYQGSGN